MEIISVTDPDAVAKARDVLRRGGVILYPTDTLYGLGADALSESALKKVYMIKAREAQKPLHAIVSDLSVAEKYAHVTDAARKLAAAFLPGPLTLILKKREDAEPAMSKGRDEFAIRMPDNQFCQLLAEAFGQPYTTTSANISGAPAQFTVRKILDQMSGNASLIDLVIDAGELPERAPSTIVNTKDGTISIVREGAIPSSEVFSVVELPHQ